MIRVKAHRKDGMIRVKAQFICHKDFEHSVPLSVFHKESEQVELPSVPKEMQNRHILYRKTARFSQFQTAVLRITADDYYRLYINGTFVTQGPAPAYPNAYYYNELDVSAYLREGINVFAVHTYYQGLRNRVWVSGDGRQMLWCTLELDGIPALVSDGSWKCTTHTGYSESGIYGYETGFAETYDSNAAEVGFFEDDYDDSAWEFASVFRHADYVLQKQPTLPLELYEVAPKTVKPIENGIFLDFGQEAVGSLNLTVRGSAGQILTVRYGEETDENGRVRWQLRCNCAYSEHWILSGNEDVLDPFDYKAFRYAEILFEEAISVVHIGMNVRHYPYRKRVTYSVSDGNPKLQQILQLCENTIRYGTQEVFVDCPTREKGQYLGDLSIAGRAHAVLTGDVSMLKKAIRNFCDSSFICKGLMAVSTSSWMQEIADYSLQFAATVLWLYRLEQDRSFLEETEPYLHGIYAHFLQFVRSDGLLENVTDKWNLVDWPQNLRDGYDFPLTNPIGSGIHNVINAFWCNFLESYDQILIVLGKVPTGRTESVKSAFCRAFYDPETGFFRDTPNSHHAAIHSNVLPLLFEIGTDRDAELRARIVHMIAQKGLSSMGVYMAYFALAALKRAGEEQLAVQLATDPNCWLLMLSEGATTTFEAWGKAQKWNTSLFHPWATAPLIVFADGILPY